MTDEEYEALHAKMFKQIVLEIEAHKAPKWKRGLFWFMDHAVWGSLERIAGVVLGFVLGALASHPHLSYDVAAHWLKMHLP